MKNAQAIYQGQGLCFYRRGESVLLPVLISGDSDFSLPIDKIKKIGRQIIVMSTRGHIAKELLDRAKYVDLRKLEHKLRK